MQVNTKTGPSVFCFEPNLSLRVFDKNGDPWFVASDIEKMFGLTNIRKRIASLDEDERSTIASPTGGSLTIVNEGGLWTLVLRSDAAVQKGTVAYRARKWVTNEVLPAIRKTGHYEVKADTLTPAQQLLVQQAVGRRAKKTASHYQTIYRAIKLRFQIAKYDQLPQSQLNECLKFINEVDLRVPEAPKYEPESALPTKPRVTYTVTADFLEKQRTFVYCIRYLFRDPLMQAMKVMQALDVPNANRLWDVVHDLNLVQLERNLENLGYPVKELECYKALMGINQ